MIWPASAHRGHHVENFEEVETIGTEMYKGMFHSLVDPLTSGVCKISVMCDYLFYFISDQFVDGEFLHHV